MELKAYQAKALGAVSAYLTQLTALAEQIAPLPPDLASRFDVPHEAFKAVSTQPYQSVTDGAGRQLPNFYIKVPTGGGKTLLACHTIELANRLYLKRQTGFVLWVVPTTQIYRQTISALKDRSHPYRQVLDQASGGRVRIVERHERFSPLDVEQQLVVLVLMLQAAGRRDKETLRVFRDNGSFTGFFPDESDRVGNEALLAEIPNLDRIYDEQSFLGPVVTASLGNVVRRLRPILILDEGHKAYSSIARDTLHKLNPSLLVELSATPLAGANVLVTITGQEVNAEGMIKLPLHVRTHETTDWRDTVRESMRHRQGLETTAREFEAQTGRHIRPINLIQVERTGNEQRGSGYIHAEDVREFLLEQEGITPDQVAVKSSEKDDIEGLDLLSRDCSVRYIITKQALQEGWDCPFAYILTVLTNPSSTLAITQLVGRILRQPHATKTGVEALDECYVHCYRRRAADVVAAVRAGFETEGLGDLAGRVITSTGPIETAKEGRKLRFREDLQDLEGKILLPKFVVFDEPNWRDVRYETDILARIDWTGMDVASVGGMELGDTVSTAAEVIVDLGESGIRDKTVSANTGGADQVLDQVYMTRLVSQVVPNPWLAHEYVGQVLASLRGRFPEATVAANATIIAEELLLVLGRERDRRAEAVFRQLLDDGTIRFLVVGGDGAYAMRPSGRERPATDKKLVRPDNTPIQLSLMEFEYESDFNVSEAAVAVFLDTQKQLAWWYRNVARGTASYHLQGWQQYRVFPDFICREDSSGEACTYVLETKGKHLLGSQDVAYKTSLFDLCNELNRRTYETEPAIVLDYGKLRFEIVDLEGWETKLRGIFAEGC